MRVALALGSGGARGYAHLGAVEELRARGHQVATVAGASMGALVGGLIAADQDQAFAEWASSLTQRDVLRLVDPVLSRGGAVNLARVMAEVESLAGDVTINELPIPFTAVATDLESRREVWFQSGSLVSAIRASIAIPGLFVPAVVNGRILVDGGLLNPLPIDPTAAIPVDFTLAVSLQGPRSPRDTGPPQRQVATSDSRQSWRKLLRRAVHSDAGPDPDTDTDTDRSAAAPDPKIAEVVTMSFEAMQALITRYRLAAHPPDVLVSIPLSSARSIDFHRAEELIDLGRRLTAKALDDAGF
ncbi:patatin-like phospholipase family protein [soil metagenome]